MSVLKAYANIKYDNKIKRRYIWNNYTTNIQNIIEIRHNREYINVSLALY